MIFYTLQGPGYELIIHDDKIQLHRKSWTKLLSKETPESSYRIEDLARFEIAVPKFLFFSGKIKWETFDGETGTFKFTTNPVMVKKIETYIQKRVIKNHELKHKIRSKKDNAA